MSGRTRLPLHRRTLLLVLASGALPMAMLALVLWTGDFSTRAKVTALVVAGSGWFAFAFAARERVVHQLQTLSGLLSALREGDFSIRARGSTRDDPLGEVHAEVNTLADTLRSNRLEATEATALLRRVMEELSLAVFAFDQQGTLVLLNPAGAALLGQPEERLRGRSAEALGLAAILAQRDDCNIDASFPGGSGRWCLRRHAFRLGGLPHELVLFADVSAALREEEVLAWQKLVRVLGHELNNSLAPVKSLAGSLRRLVSSPRRAPDWEDDLRAGLDIIETRADSLGRFMAGYSQLARLPKPDRQLTEIGPLLRRVTSLEFTPATVRGEDGEPRIPARVPVTLNAGPELSASVDPAQLEQVLINLLKNAVEAVAEHAATSDGEAPTPTPGVRVSWDASGGRLAVRIEDDGPGLANPQNLFVPFFTTKEKGSGIGLVLCRQIVENHGGTLSIANREPPQVGAAVVVRLPL